MKLNQREDLDALRGIAIVAVVLFHLNSKLYFLNGHLGVDVFFVLSGYFIFTSHCLMPDRSLFEFFSKRIWRIFPGYYCFLVGVAIFAHFLLIRNDYCFFIQDLKKAACFLSNFQFDTEKGYFDTVQEHSFLLHTWSLSVEIQFYLISAIIAQLLKKTSAKLQLTMILIVLSIGSHYFVSENIAFYSVPCRLWQFLFGYLAMEFQNYHILPLVNDGVDNRSSSDTDSLVPKISPQLPHGFLKTFCVFSIVTFCLLPISHKDLLLLRILVTVCTCYVVSSTANNFSAIDTLWNNKYLQFSGKISYSWYLWHWPVSVSFSYFNLDIMEPVNLAIYLLAPFGMACLCTFLIERPLIRMDHGKYDTIAIGILPAMVFILGITILLHMDQATSQKLGNATISMNNTAAERIITNATKYVPGASNKAKLLERLNACQKASVDALCSIGEVNATDHTLIWGDSHTQTIFAAHTLLWEISNSTIGRVTEISRSDCRPFFDCDYINGEDCKRHIPRDYEKLRNMTISRVILASSTVKKLLEAKVSKIILLQPIPEPDSHIPQQLEKSLKFGWNLTLLDIDRAKDKVKMADVREVMKNVTNACSICSLWDPADVLCDQTICPTFFVEDNIVRSYYYDENHLNDDGAYKLSRLFNSSKESIGTFKP